MGIFSFLLERPDEQLMRHARKDLKERRYQKWHLEEYRQQQREKEHRQWVREQEEKKRREEEREKRELKNFLRKQSKMKQLEQKYDDDYEFWRGLHE